MANLQSSNAKKAAEVNEQLMQIQKFPQFNEEPSIQIIKQRAIEASN